MESKQVGKAVRQVPPELVLFDCDGVLVDSEGLIEPILKRMLSQLDWSLSAEEVADRFSGRSHAFLLNQVQSHLGHLPPVTWIEELERLCSNALREGLRPVDGVEEALDQIPLRTCVASNSRCPKLRWKLEFTGLYERFAGRIFCPAEGMAGKPAPDLLLYAAARMNAEPSRCAVVEDTKYGIDAARAAGMVPFLYTKRRPSIALQEPGVVVFTEMRELPHLLGCGG